AGSPTPSWPAWAVDPTRWGVEDPHCGGSNAMGIFHAFLDDTEPLVRLIGCEAGGDGIASGRHSATITGGTAGVLHGARSFVMQDEDGQTIESHSVSAGLDYPSVGPEHAWLADI